jgi:bla regulator protein blaR1
VLIGLAAVSVERVLAELRRPRRFAWLGAFAVALAFPPLSWLLAPEPQLTLAVGAETQPGAPLAAYAQLDWNTTLLWLWIVATTVLAVLYVAAWLRLALLAKRWPRETSDAIPVVVADDLGPAVLGIVRPRVVLPRWLMDAPAAVRSTVVAHELEHIAARDQACIVAAQLITILLPWNLPLWWFARRLRAAIEIDCDARVLHRGADAAQYAEVLLAVGQRRSASPYVAATLIEPVTQLERRVRIMLTKPHSASIGRVCAAATVAAALAACASQLDPPVPATSARPPATADSAVTQIASGTNPGGVKITRGAQGELTLEASELVMRVVNGAHKTDNSVFLAGSMTKTGESVLLEGNVQMGFDGMSISASRALGTPVPNAGWVWTLNDAKIVRAATTSTE